MFGRMVFAWEVTERTFTMFSNTIRSIWSNAKDDNLHEPTLFDKLYNYLIAGFLTVIALFNALGNGLVNAMGSHVASAGMGGAASYAFVAGATGGGFINSFEFYCGDT